MSRGQFIPCAVIWGGESGDGGNKCPWKGLPTPADHTGRPGNFLGLFFVHAVLSMVLIWLQQGSSGRYMKEPCCS